MSEEILRSVNADFERLVRELDSPPGVMKAEMEEVNRKLRERRALAGPRVLPIFLRPYFLTSEQVDYLRKVVEHILNCQEKLIRLYFREEKFQDLFELTETEKPLVEIPPRLERNIFFSRLDSIMQPGGEFKFLEFNCDSPGGAYYSDIQTSILRETKVIRALEERYEFMWEEYRPKVLDTLVLAWRQFSGRGKPNIAVMGDPNVTNVEEFKLFAEYFAQKGYESFFTDPWSLEYDGKHLAKEGRRIDLIYRRGVLADYSKHVKETRPVVDAYREGKVCFVNPLSAKLGDNKNLLSLLTDPRVESLFSRDERKVIENHIPWTRVLREMKTDYRGMEIDLVPFIRKEKDRFVIKPNSEYGGKGVVIGHEAEQKVWDEAIDEAARAPRVVQEYVPIPTMEFPVFDPEMRFAAKKINTNFFTFSGHYGGGFVRASDSSVINISAGGALVAFMVVRGFRDSNQ